MKTIKKNVYYCEFCNKKGLAHHAINTHEKHCTANPNRQCRLCEMSAGLADDISEFKSRFKLIENKYDLDEAIKLGVEVYSHTVEWIGKPVTIKELEDRYGCPNCILAILRQTGMNKHYFAFKYDYINESSKYFSEKIAEKNERGYQY